VAPRFHSTMPFGRLMQKGPRKRHLAAEACTTKDPPTREVSGFFWVPPRILRILPRRTTTCSLDWKNNWKVTTFRPTRRILLPRRPGWTDNFLNFFWVAFSSYSNGLGSVLSFVGSMMTKSRVWPL